MFGWLFKRDKVEKRSAASGFTSELLSARESYLSGRSGLAELTATVQSCVSLWEHGFALADVVGTTMLDRRSMSLIGRSLALRGEAVFLIRDRLIPCSDWDLRTRDGVPTAYRVSVSEAGGGRTETVLAAEVLHVRIGADPAAPWTGTSPLRRTALTASLLNSLEAALAEVYENAPIGSMIIPFPESPETDLETLGRGFRGRRGRVLLRESVNVQAAGGPAPAQDWRPSDVSPDLSKAMTTETLDAARNAICCAFGVLPGLFYHQTTGPMVREAQRHLAQWALQPVAELIAEEASAKLGGEVRLDVLRPTQSFDSGGAARALSTLVRAMAEAKAADLPPEALAAAFKRLDWES
jgi:phage portal protein BeeE